MGRLSFCRRLAVQRHEQGLVERVEELSWFHLIDTPSLLAASGQILRRLRQDSRGMAALGHPVARV